MHFQGRGETTEELYLTEAMNRHMRFWLSMIVATHLHPIELQWLPYT